MESINVFLNAFDRKTSPQGLTLAGFLFAIGAHD
jgi:hypothetical protein